MSASRRRPTSLFQPGMAAMWACTWGVAVGLRDLRVAACEEGRLCDLAGLRLRCRLARFGRLRDDPLGGGLLCALRRLPRRLFRQLCSLQSGTLPSGSVTVATSDVVRRLWLVVAYLSSKAKAEMVSVLRLLKPRPAASGQMRPLTVTSLAVERSRVRISAPRLQRPRGLRSDPVRDQRPEKPLDLARRNPQRPRFLSVSLTPRISPPSSPCRSSPRSVSVPARPRQESRAPESHPSACVAYAI